MEKPVKIDGVYYESQKAAAAALGVTPSCISAWIRNPDVNYPPGSLKRGQHRKPKIAPVIRGVQYESVRSAARALGVDAATIYNARKRGALDLVGAKHGESDNE